MGEDVIHWMTERWGLASYVEVLSSINSSNSLLGLRSKWHRYAHVRSCSCGIIVANARVVKQSLGWTPQKTDRPARLPWLGRSTD